MAWEAMARLEMTWINQGQMSSADCSYYKSPVVIFHLFIRSIFQRLITWPLKMNPNHIVPTSFRHDFGMSVPGLPDKVTSSFLLTRLAKKGKN